MAKIKLISKTAKEPKSSKVKNVKDNNQKRVKAYTQDDAVKPRKKKPKPITESSSNKLPTPVDPNLAIDAETVSWPVLHEDAFTGWPGEFANFAGNQSGANKAAVLVLTLLRFAALLYPNAQNLWLDFA